jgi:hypothetical protein
MVQQMTTGVTRVQGFDSALRKGVLTGIRNPVTFPEKVGKVLDA